MSADVFLRMPLVSKKKGRISPYDLLLVRADFAAQKLSIGEPIGPLYNGIDGVVLINATFSGVPCAVRFQGLNGNIARSHNEVRDIRGGVTIVPVIPLDPIDDREAWKLFIRGLQRGVAFQFGPRLYAVFETTTGVVPQRDKSNLAASSLKSLGVGVDAVELMRATLYDYGVTQRGELNVDDFNQFVELYTRMKRAYAHVTPKFPFDLHANNCMYKIENGKRIWLWTDIDEHPSYMRPNHDTPRQMAVALFTNIRRDDAMWTAAPVSPPKAASPRRSALAVVPKPKSPARVKVPTSSDIARQEAKAAALLKRTRGEELARLEAIAARFAAAPHPAFAAARPPIRKPRRTLAEAKSSRKSPIKPYSPMMDAKVKSRSKKRPIKPYSPMMDAKVKSRSKRSPMKPYSPMMDAKVLEDRARVDREIEERRLHREALKYGF